MSTPLSDRLNEHLGLVVTATALGFVALRIFSMAGYDPLTAQAIVQANSNANSALGAVLATMPMVASVAFGLLAGALVPEVVRTGRLPGHWWVYSVGASFVFALVIPWSYFGVAGVLLLLSLGVHHRRKRRPAAASTQSATDERNVNAMIVTAVLVLVVASASNPTLPSEAIQPKGENAQTGFVLNQSREELVVLLEDVPPRVERFATATTTHEICVSGQTSWWTQTLIQAVEGAPYPDCPELS